MIRVYYLYDGNYYEEYVEDLESTQDLLGSMIKNELLVKIEDALDQLTNKQRRRLELYIECNYKLTKVAKMECVTVRAAKSSIDQALVTLKNEIRKFVQ